MNGERAIAFPSLGLKKYLSALRYVTAVVGNSSSGIIEVPSFGIPTLNIGDRQKGRIAAESVINCNTNKDDIYKGICKILERTKIHCSNPYEKESTAQSIVSVLKNTDYNLLLEKHFYDIK